MSAASRSIAMAETLRTPGRSIAERPGTRIVRQFGSPSNPLAGSGYFVLREGDAEVGAAPPSFLGLLVALGGARYRPSLLARALMAPCDLFNLAATIMSDTRRSRRNRSCASSASVQIFLRFLMPSRNSPSSLDLHSIVTGCSASSKFWLFRCANSEPPAAAVSHNRRRPRGAFVFPSRAKKYRPLSFQGLRPQRCSLRERFRPSKAS
jgi:hypothetical protein